MAFRAVFSASHSPYDYDWGFMFFFFSFTFSLQDIPLFGKQCTMELMSVRNFGNWVEQIDSYAKQGPRAEGAGARVGAWEPWTRSRRRLDGRVHFHEPANERAGRARGRIGHSVISTSAAPGQQPPGIFCIVRCTLYVVRCIRVQGNERESRERPATHRSVVASGSSE